MIELLIGILLALSSGTAEQQAPKAITACEWAESAITVWNDFNRGYYDSGLYDWSKEYESADIADESIGDQYIVAVSSYMSYTATFSEQWEALGGYEETQDIWLDGLDMAQMRADGLALMRQGAASLDIDIYNSGIDLYNRSIDIGRSTRDRLVNLSDECQGISSNDDHT